MTYSRGLSLNTVSEQMPYIIFYGFTAGPQRLMSACSKPTCRSASSTSRVGRPPVERIEDRVYLVRSCTPSPSHSQWRRTGRSRLSSSGPGPISQRPRCVRRQWHDVEDSHRSCTVVMLLRIETDQIYHAVFAITRAKHSGHCSGSQPVRLLQCCLRWSSSL